MATRRHLTIRKYHLYPTHFADKPKADNSLKSSSFQIRFGSLNSLQLCNDTDSGSKIFLRMRACFIKCRHASPQPALSVFRFIRHTLLFFLMYFFRSLASLLLLKCSSDLKKTVPARPRSIGVVMYPVICPCFVKTSSVIKAGITKVNRLSLKRRPRKTIRAALHTNLFGSFVVTLCST